LNDFRMVVEKETSNDQWVSDGNYSKVRDIVWGHATDVIWLNYSFPLVFSRALRRTIRRAISREELFSGNRESLRMTFFSKDSLLLWILKTYRRNRIKYRAFQTSPEWAHLQFMEFRRPGDATDFLFTLGKSVTTPYPADR
jgi:adenylate kinase family enzyme